MHPLLFFAVVLLALFAFRYDGQVGPAKGPGAPVGDTVDREYDDVPKAVRDVLSRYPADAILYFFRLLGDLPDFLSSADERATVEPYGLRLETRLAFRRTEGVSSTVLVPLLQVSKGVLVDELEITDGRGTGVHRLSAYETRGLLGWAVRSLVGFAREQHDPYAGVAPAGPLDELVRIVSRPHEWPEKVLDARLKRCLHALGLSADWHARLLRVCSGLAQSDLIVVEVERPDGLGFDLAYRQLLACQSVRSGKLWRTRLGLAPDTVDAPPMVYAGRAQTYQFQLAPIPGRYVLRHEVERVHSREAPERNQIERSLGRIDVRKEDTPVRSHAHCSITLLDPPAARTDLDLEDYESVVDYRETPPGALGGVTLMATTTTLLTLFFALHPGDGDADVPALLVAVPAFMAIVIGHWSDTSKLPKSSVSAYLGLLGTMVVAAAGALLSLLDGVQRLAWWRVRPQACCGIGELHTSWPWLVLAASASALTLYLWLRLGQGVRHYRRQQHSCSVGDPDLA